MQASHEMMVSCRMQWCVMNDAAHDPRMATCPEVHTHQLKFRRMDYHRMEGAVGVVAAQQLPSCQHNPLLLLQNSHSFINMFVYLSKKV